MLEYLTWDLIFLSVWFLFYYTRKDLRKKMLLTSIVATPLGLFEPLFVPSYWNPSTLFDLAAKTGLDIESLIYAFTVTGIAAVLYDILLNKKLVKVSKKANKLVFIIILPLVFFGSGFIFDNFIYSTISSLFIGSLAIWIYRKDLFKHTILSGIIFLIFYTAILLLIDNLIFMGWVKNTWNIANLTGIVLFGIPMEELLFALMTGFFWYGLYNAVNGYGLKE